MEERINMVGYNAYAGMNGLNYGAYNNGNFNNVPQNFNIPQQPGSDGLPYVHGIDGAYAFSMPNGVQKIILWDDTVDSFYIKGYDNMGRPKILAWKDFTDHVEPEKEEAKPPEIDTSKYLTKDDLIKFVKRLSVGERGRIVMSNEHDA